MRKKTFEKKLRKQVMSLNKIMQGIYDRMLSFTLEMQGSGPAAQPVSKFAHGWAFSGTRTISAGLILGPVEAITMHYPLLRACGD